MVNTIFAVAWFSLGIVGWFTHGSDSISFWAPLILAVIYAKAPNA